MKKILAEIESIVVNYKTSLIALFSATLATLYLTGCITQEQAIGAGLILTSLGFLKSKDS